MEKVELKCKIINTGAQSAAHSYSWPVCHVGKLAAAATYHHPISAITHTTKQSF